MRLAFLFALAPVAAAAQPPPGTLDAAFGHRFDAFPELGFVRLGALSLKGGASGTLSWDEFESRRQTAIGP